MLKHVLSLLLVIAACTPAPPTRVPPPPPVDVAEPRALTDTNDDPAIVEVELVAEVSSVALDGTHPTEVWAYRDGALPGSVAVVPGPLLEARVGDLVVVHFRSELPEPTTVHWHGLRLPSAMDGSTSTQRAVQTGETFEYRFVVGDAGVFWYHPHVNSDEQVERGLYGPIVVHEAAPLPATRERVLVLDDVTLNVDGQLDITADPLDEMYGREGNALLVNGTIGGAIAVQPGARELWRIINAANARSFNLKLEGVTFLVVGGDGGLLGSPQMRDSLLVVPGERYEVLVEAGLERRTRELVDLGHQRSAELPQPRTRTLATVVVDGEAASAPVLQFAWPTFEPLAVGPSTRVRRFVLSEEMIEGRSPRFFINGEYWPINRAVEVDVDDLDIWELENTGMMGHPFHIHGLFFQVLDETGAPRSEVGWKDTVDIPPDSTVRLAVNYSAEGMWMFHCQILEHAERGMMGDLMVRGR